MLNPFPVTVWMAHKATIRGKLIAIATARKKHGKKERKQLEIKLRELRHVHKKNPCKILFKDVAQTRLELNLVLTTTAEQDI